MTATTATETLSKVPNSSFKDDTKPPPTPPTITPLRRKCLSDSNLQQRIEDEASTAQQEQTQEDILYASLTFKANQFVTHKRSKKCHNDRFQKHYTLGPILGRGGFGTCFRCTHIASGHERACKIFMKSDNRKENRNIIHEFKTLAQLDHPNLIKVYELFEDKKHFFIITDLYEGGDLFDLIEREGPMREQDVAIVIQRLLCCLNYCHEKGLVHRDLKPENVLLTAAKGTTTTGTAGGSHDFANIKLIDFGLARQERPNQAFHTVVGSPFYVSPQVVAGRYNRGCDIWAVGALAYVLLCGKPPFEAATDLEMLERISVGWVHFDWEEFDCVSPDCTAFIRFLMTYEEEERPTASQCLQHPWLIQHCLNTAAKAIVGTVHVTTPPPLPIVQQQQVTGGSEKQQPGGGEGIALASSTTTTISLKNDIQNALHALLRFQSRNCKLKQATGALLASHFLCTTNTATTTTTTTTSTPLQASRVHDRIQRERLDLLFRIFDRRHTGTLSVHDLQLAFADYLHMYLTQEEIKNQLWPNINYSGSGSVTYSEFITVCTLEGVLFKREGGESNDDDGLLKNGAESKIRAVYNYLDTDQKGYLNNRDLLLGFKLDPETADIICHKMISEVVVACNDDDDDDDDDDDLPPVITRQVFERAMGRTTEQLQTNGASSSFSSAVSNRSTINIPQRPTVTMVKVPHVLRRKIRRTRSMIVAEAA